ncbi:MAG: hypothetical protein CK532_07400 [Flavobacteriales bacterium]|nr:MAG: hypothetical protein CK532_07400 [Flavobacteriales bacterium]
MTYYKGKYHGFQDRIFTILLSLFFLQSCGVKKIIPEHQHLLKKNSISTESNKPDKRLLHLQILHQPNKRVLFNKLPVYLWAYALGTIKKSALPLRGGGLYKLPSDSIAWRRKLRKKWGEPPVFIDTSLVRISAENINNYLFNRGYFDAKTDYSIVYGNRKAKILYKVKQGTPYRLNSFFRQPKDSALTSLIDTLVAENNAFRLWWGIDLEELNSAKEKLSLALRDRGYYDANPDLFHYEIDTLHDKKEGAIFLKIDNPINQKTFKRYRYGPVFLTIECSEIYQTNTYPQSVIFDGNYLTLNHYPIKSSVLDKVILIDSGKWVNQSVTNLTYTGLVDMALFSYIDMHQEVDSVKGQIITRIRAKALPRIYTQIEPQGLYSPNGSSGTNMQTGSQRSFGLAGIASFSNRNIMGNGGSFKISSVTSNEAIFKRDKLGDFAYAFQQGFNLTLSMPNFRLFEKINVKNQYQRKNTVFSLSYQYEKNPNFIRTSLPASISFQFIRKNFSWYYTPLEISFNRNKISPSFLGNLAKFDQDFVKRVFTDQLITASKIGGIYSNNRNNTGQTYFFGRMGIETSGNLHRMVRSLYETNFKSDSAYQFLGVNYFQYTKIESEIRIRRSIDNLNSVAFRANFGIAIPYGNSTIIPYDKRYFIGGSTSLRGWRPRGLGPGNTPDTAASIIDRSGEFAIETNLEYRFTLIKNLIESALFLDAGNIWNLSKAGSSSSGFGVLTSQNFLEELALNTGIGFRFDLSLFVFRVDWGFPIRDPRRPLSKRWVMTGSVNDYFQKTAVAIGIGYPF